MKKIILMLVIPFSIKAQTPPDTKEVKPSTEENISQSERSKKDAKQLIEGYRQRAIKGEPVSTLASLYSEDPGSAKNGGKYEGVQKGMMVAEFETVAFSLKPGDISEVFETKYGYHFIQLISRNGDVVDLRHILVTAK